MVSVSLQLAGAYKTMKTIRYSPDVPDYLEREREVRGEGDFPGVHSIYIDPKFHSLGMLCRMTGIRAIFCPVFRTASLETVSR